MKETFRALFKTLFWLITGCFYGLLPVGVTLLLSSLNNELVYSVDNIIKEGVLIFLSVSISASVMVDYVFTSLKFPKWIEYILYGYPWILALISSVIYSQLINKSNLSETIDVQNFVQLQYLSVIMTLVYVFIVKTIIFQSSKISIA